jgi:hypothetical protein
MTSFEYFKIFWTSNGIYKWMGPKFLKNRFFLKKLTFKRLKMVKFVFE